MRATAGAAAALVLTVGAAFLLAPGVGLRGREAVLAALGGACMLALLRLLRRLVPTEPLSRGRQSEGMDADRRLPAVAALERSVELAAGSAFDLHFGLRPVLREIAAARLAARRRIDLVREPERAREALGEELWSLVEPNRRPPTDHRAPGLLPARLGHLVETLERL